MKRFRKSWNNNVYLYPFKKLNPKCIYYYFYFNISCMDYIRSNSIQSFYQTGYRGSFCIGRLACKLMTNLFIQGILASWHANDPLFNREGSTHFILCGFWVMSKLTILSFLSSPCKHLCSWYMRRFQVGNLGSDWWCFRCGFISQLSSIRSFTLQDLSFCHNVHCWDIVFSLDFVSFNWVVNPILVDVQRLR